MPIDATFPDVEISNKANRYGYTYGITVNSLGERFFDEGEVRHLDTYAKTGGRCRGYGCRGLSNVTMTRSAGC